MVLDKNCSFFCAIFRMLYAAFPFHHGPSWVIICRQLAEYRFKIHLAITKRSKPAGPIDPTLISAIYTLLSGRIKFSILDMKHSNPLMIEIDIRKIVETLKNEM